MYSGILYIHTNTCLSMLRVNSDMFSQCCYAGHAQYNSYTEGVCLSIWTL